MSAEQPHERVHDGVDGDAVAVQLRRAVHDGVELRVGGWGEGEQRHVAGQGCVDGMTSWDCLGYR
eukprot:CAMPEP_0182482488 /NCGR_PEP_ID=MMETSP1319-20130603/39393_1 /TAXON_ID=172717 /ORGANISM="Bolidomonas pacifica, Strain RCC208" /LENGTH=64 /DNA_ID=CAMNT_0024684203 /DNA_START=285 /DNA_END=479 /DNA_ORIENTATION=-